MESQRNEEARTSEAKEEVMDLMICIEQERFDILLELYKMNEHNAGLDIILNSVRECIIKKVNERYGVDLS